MLLDDAIEAIPATARSSRGPRRALVDIALALMLRDCGLHRSEAVVLVWSDIERWDGGNGRLLIEGSTADQIGLGEVVFITRRAIATWDDICQLHGNCDRWYNSVGATKFIQDESAGHAAQWLE